ncbi:hypothetical protein B0H12DRAFT_283118 [Mycena haematopus]|nr:hypothetical protein B0H12DRAFT_283118 [Mycena haematopus]
MASSCWLCSPSVASWSSAAGPKYLLVSAISPLAQATGLWTAYLCHSHIRTKDSTTTHRSTEGSPNSLHRAQHAAHFCIRKLRWDVILKGSIHYFPAVRICFILFASLLSLHAQFTNRAGGNVLKSDAGNNMVYTPRY